MNPHMFSVVGAQKSGTTWLYDFLRQHPQVFVPHVKELNYFWVRERRDERREINRLSRALSNLSSRIADQKNSNSMHSVDAILDMADRTDDLPYQNDVQMKRVGDLAKLIAAYSGQLSYMDLFSHKEETHKAFGELSPSYAMLNQKTFETMAGLHPEYRFVFIMRDPIERFWSSVRMLSDRRPETLRKAGNIRNLFLEKLGESSHLVEMTNYARTIQALEAVVPRERVHYMFYERLFSEDGPSELKGLTDFLEVDQMSADLGKRVWKTGTKRVLPSELTKDMRSRAFSAFKDVYAFVESKFGDSAPANWGNP